MDGQALERAESRIFCQSVQEALGWLADDRFSAGYRCLLAGMHRVSELAERGEPWARSLVDSYRSALFQYACIYPVSRRVRMDLPDSSAWLPHGTRPEDAPHAIA